MEVVVRGEVHLPSPSCLNAFVSVASAFYVSVLDFRHGWLGSRVVSMLDSGAEGTGFKSQSRHCWVTVLGKLFTPIMPLFTKQRNW